MTYSRRSTLQEIGEKRVPAPKAIHRQVSSGHPSVSRSDLPGSVSVSHDPSVGPNVCIKLTFFRSTGSKTYFHLSYHQTHNLITVLRSMIDTMATGAGILPITSLAGRRLHCLGKFINVPDRSESTYTVLLAVDGKTKAELEVPGVEWLIRNLNVLAEDVPQVKGGRRGRIG